jgi:hypothetical protein
VIPETLRVEIEAAACEAVHNAWMGAKFFEGVTSRKSETGEELMVPYGDLSDAAKALDAASVQAALDAALPILEAHYGAKVEEAVARGDALEARNKRLRQWARFIAATTRDALEGMEAESLDAGSPTDDYRAARGIVPAPPGSPSPEEAIRRIRGGA